MKSNKSKKSLWQTLKEIFYEPNKNLVKHGFNITTKGLDVWWKYLNRISKEAKKIAKDKSWLTKGLVNVWSSITSAAWDILSAPQKTKEDVTRIQWEIDSWKIWKTEWRIEQVISGWLWALSSTPAAMSWILPIQSVLKATWWDKLLENNEQWAKKYAIDTLVNLWLSKDSAKSRVNSAFNAIRFWVWFKWQQVMSKWWVGNYLKWGTITSSPDLAILAVNKVLEDSSKKPTEEEVTNAASTAANWLFAWIWAFTKKRPNINVNNTPTPTPTLTPTPTPTPTPIPKPTPNLNTKQNQWAKDSVIENNETNALKPSFKTTPSKNTPSKNTTKNYLLKNEEDAKNYLSTLDKESKNKILKKAREGLKEDIENKNLDIYWIKYNPKKKNKQINKIESNENLLILGYTNKQQNSKNVTEKDTANESVISLVNMKWKNREKIKDWLTKLPEAIRKPLIEKAEKFFLENKKNNDYSIYMKESGINKKKKRFFIKMLNKDTNIKVLWYLKSLDNQNKKTKNKEIRDIIYGDNDTTKWWRGKIQDRLETTSNKSKENNTIETKKEDSIKNTDNKVDNTKKSDNNKSEVDELVNAVNDMLWLNNSETKESNEKIKEYNKKKEEVNEEFNASSKISKKTLNILGKEIKVDKKSSISKTILWKTVNFLTKNIWIIKDTFTNISGTLNAIQIRVDGRNYRLWDYIDGLKIETQTIILDKAQNILNIKEIKNFLDSNSKTIRDAYNILKPEIEKRVNVSNKNYFWDNKVNIEIEWATDEGIRNHSLVLGEQKNTNADFRGSQKTKPKDYNINSQVTNVLGFNMEAKLNSLHKQNKEWLSKNEIRIIEWKNIVDSIIDKYFPSSKYPEINSFYKKYFNEYWQFTVNNKTNQANKKISLADIISKTDYKKSKKDEMTDKDVEKIENSMYSRWYIDSEVLFKIKDIPWFRWIVDQVNNWWELSAQQLDIIMNNIDKYASILKNKSDEWTLYNHDPFAKVHNYANNVSWLWFNKKVENTINELVWRPTQKGQIASEQIKNYLKQKFGKDNILLRIVWYNPLLAAEGVWWALSRAIWLSSSFVIKANFIWNTWLLVQSLAAATAYWIPQHITGAIIWDMSIASKIYKKDEMDSTKNFLEDAWLTFRSNRDKNISLKWDADRSTKIKRWIREKINFWLRVFTAAWTRTIHSVNLNAYMLKSMQNAEREWKFIYNNNKTIADNFREDFMPSLDPKDRVFHFTKINNIVGTIEKSWSTAWLTSSLADLSAFSKVLSYSRWKYSLIQDVLMEATNAAMGKSLWKSVWREYNRVQAFMFTVGTLWILQFIKMLTEDKEDENIDKKTDDEYFNSKVEAIVKRIYWTNNPSEYLQKALLVTPWTGIAFTAKLIWWISDLTQWIILQWMRMSDGKEIDNSYIEKPIKKLFSWPVNLLEILTGRGTPSNTTSWLYKYWKSVNIFKEEYNNPFDVLARFMNLDWEKSKYIIDSDKLFKLKKEINEINSSSKFKDSINSFFLYFDRVKRTAIWTTNLKETVIASDLWDSINDLLSQDLWIESFVNWLETTALVKEKLLKTDSRWVSIITKAFLDTQKAADRLRNVVWGWIKDIKKLWNITTHLRELREKNPTKFSEFMKTIYKEALSGSTAGFIDTIVFQKHWWALLSSHISDLTKQIISAKKKTLWKQENIDINKKLSIIDNTLKLIWDYRLDSGITESLAIDLIKWNILSEISSRKITLLDYIDYFKNNKDSPLYRLMEVAFQKAWWILKIQKITDKTDLGKNIKSILDEKKNKFSNRVKPSNNKKETTKNISNITGKYNNSYLFKNKKWKKIKNLIDTKKSKLSELTKRENIETLYQKK